MADDNGGEYALRFFKSIDGELVQVGTGSWHGLFPFLALQRAAELARDLLADAFQVTTPAGVMRHFTVGRDGVATQAPPPAPKVLPDAVLAMCTPAGRA